MVNWNNIIETILGLLLGATVCLMLCAMGGCSSAKPMAAEHIVYKTDTLYKTNARADTLHILDSVFVNQYTKGDTVYKEKTTWKWRDKVSVRVDTLYKAVLRTDSVRMPIPMERKPSVWERTVWHAGNLFVGILTVATVWLIAWVARRKMKA